MDINTKIRKVAEIGSLNSDSFLKIHALKKARDETDDDVVKEAVESLINGELITTLGEDIEYYSKDFLPASKNKDFLDLKEKMINEKKSLLTDILEIS